MAGAMHKMAVYLGLVEDDPRYDDGYDSYEEYEDEYGEPVEPADPETERPAARGRGEFLMDPAPPAAPRASTLVAGPSHATDLARITTLHPRTYNEARTIGEHFREGTPVIMNLTEMVDSDAKRLVDLRRRPDLRPAREHRPRDEQGLPVVPGQRRGDGGGQGADSRTRFLQPELDVQEYRHSRWRARGSDTRGSHPRCPSRQRR